MRVPNLFVILCTIALLISRYEMTPSVCAVSVSDDSEQTYDDIPIDPSMDGFDNLKEGTRLFQLKKYDEASVYLWRAVLMQGEQSLGDSVGFFVECTFCLVYVSYPFHLTYFK